MAAVKSKNRTGIDFCEPLIEKAKENHLDIRFEIMEAENITLKDKYDIIILSNLIGVIEDIEHVFNELNKVSHEKTRIIKSFGS